MPRVSFQARTGTGRPLAQRPAADRPRGLLAGSLQVIARSADQELDLRLKHPRPIYYEPDRGRRLAPVGGLFAAQPGAPFPAALPWAALRLSANLRIAWSHCAPVVPDEWEHRFAAAGDTSAP